MSDQTGHGQIGEQCSFSQHPSHLTTQAAENIGKSELVECFCYLLSLLRRTIML